MYELVNTSLSNGLIPGTHGFATVAMTKGLPDVLRTRLETYCAYSHRTGAHDATYFKENPVNWFHVTLPQGEHIVGRVAPTDFDYTGRTNRIARLLVFQKGEMPAIGGAEVLKKKSNCFVEPWTGEARWLEPDRLTLGRLRLEMPVVTSDAPAWRATFGGGEGVRLAKGFARLLAKNMAGIGKTIYFKTTVKHDVDGTRLLALFADLIALLPVELRGKATFSTYPAALPQGTVCHLRGVYDHDRIFDAAAVTQPWVDCENGTVHNASLLPPEEVQSKTAEKIETNKVITPGSIKRQATMPTIRNRPQTEWMPPQKDGTKTLFIGIIAAVILLLLVAAGFGVWCWMKYGPKPDGCTTSQEQEKTVELQLQEEKKRKEQAEAERRRGAQKAEEEKQRKAEEERLAREANEKKERERRAKEKEEKLKKDKLAEERAAEKAAVEKLKAESSDKVAFANAKVELLNAVPGGILKVGEKHLLTNGTLKVFWYDKSMNLTNCSAGMKITKVGNQTGKSFRPDRKEILRKVSGSFLIWYDGNANKLYWDWSPLEQTQFKQWFTLTNEINLIDLSFGKQKEVREIWKRSFGDSFPIECEGEIGQDKPKMRFDGNIGDFSRNELLTVDDVISKILEKQNSRQSNEQEALARKVERYKIQQKIVSDTKNKYDRFAAQLVKVKEELKDLRKSGKKKAFDKSTEETKLKKQRDLESNIDELWDDTQLKPCKSFFGITLKYDNHKITEWEKLAKRYEEEIAKLEKEMTSKKAVDQEKESNIRAKVKAGRYRIVKVGEEVR